MEAPKRGPNLFELLTENERLSRELAAAHERLERLSLEEGETRLVVPAGLLESELGAARKLAYQILYTEARENEGYACFSDRELGRRTGVDRTSARDTREALEAEGLIQVLDCTPATGVRKIHVCRAAEAWQRIKRKPVAPDPQQALWGESSVTAQPVEGVASPPSRTAPVAPSESAGAAHGPPRTLSIAEEARRLRLAAAAKGLGVLPRENPQALNGPVDKPGGFTSGKPPGTERSGEQVGVLPGGENPQAAAESGPEHGEGISPACARDTFKKPAEVASKSNLPARKTESVPCQVSVSCSAQDSPARAPGPMAATVAALAAELLDPAGQIDRAEQIGRLAAIIIREGGQCAPNPKFPGDGRLNPFAARKIATAVIAGWLDWADVMRLIDTGAAKSLADPERTPAPWVYLVGTMPKIFAERERCWAPSVPKPKPR